VPAALEDRWIASRFHRVAEQVNTALGEYRFHEAAQQVYSFFWDEFCDWYLELLKLRLNFGDLVPAASKDAQSLVGQAGQSSAAIALTNAISLFEAALRLLAPFMPFLTEELWTAICDGKPPQKSIALSRFPQSDAAQISPEAESSMGTLQELIVAIRNLRAEMKIEPRQKTPVRIFAEPAVRQSFDVNREAIARLANASAIEYSEKSLAGAPGARSSGRFDVQVVFERKVDAAAERERLTKELANCRMQRSWPKRPRM